GTTKAGAMRPAAGSPADQAGLSPAAAAQLSGAAGSANMSNDMSGASGNTQGAASSRQPRKLSETVQKILGRNPRQTIPFSTAQATSGSPISSMDGNAFSSQPNTLPAPGAPGGSMTASKSQLPGQSTLEQAPYPYVNQGNWQNQMQGPASTNAGPRQPGTSGLKGSGQNPLPGTSAP